MVKISYFCLLYRLGHVPVAEGVNERGRWRERGILCCQSWSTHSEGSEPLLRTKRMIVKRRNYGMFILCNGFRDIKNTGLALCLLRWSHNHDRKAKLQTTMCYPMKNKTWYIHIYTHIRIYIHTYMCMCICVFMYTCAYMFIDIMFVSIWICLEESG